MSLQQSSTDDTQIAWDSLHQLWAREYDVPVVWAAGPNGKKIHAPERCSTEPERRCDGGPDAREYRVGEFENRIVWADRCQLPACQAYWEEKGVSES